MDQPDQVGLITGSLKVKKEIYDIVIWLNDQNLLMLYVGK
jgi:hypothetical protein